MNHWELGDPLLKTYAADPTFRTAAKGALQGLSAGQLEGFIGRVRALQGLKACAGNPALLPTVASKAEQGWK